MTVKDLDHHIPDTRHSYSDPIMILLGIWGWQQNRKHFHASFFVAYADLPHYHDSTSIFL